MKMVDFESGQCRKIRSYLDTYLSNELTAETNLEVLKHLEICETCSRELDDRARIKAQLKRVVLNVQAPDTLQKRIRIEMRRTHRFNFNFNPSWMLAAAAVIVVAVMLGVLFRPGAGRSNGSIPRQLSLTAEVAPADTAGQILKVGFDDHVSCAIDHGMSNRHFSAAEMSEKLGPQYEGLIEAAKEKMPQDFEIIVGHRCHYQNREFIHLLMRRQQEVVSLIVTPKNGESFPVDGAAPVMNAAGIPVHEASWHNLQVAGFETSNHLVFVVSNEPKGENEQIASMMMPAVADFLRTVVI
jgi:anti-sigma factor (TIGR02949 family)